MKDLSLDAKKPWTGPGRDPRSDRWEAEVEEEDEEDENSMFSDFILFWCLKPNLFTS
jgi:hypothetical protein